jgi:DNA (cytosine-5)-methyltransferase 1
LGADDLGGNHHRKRLWILAYDNQVRRYSWRLEGQRVLGREQTRHETDSSFEDAPYTDKEGISGQMPSFNPSAIVGQNRKGKTWGRALSDALLNHVQVYGFTGRSGGDFEPPLRRTDDGLAYGVDRIKAIGNGQVPIVAKTAWEILGQKL